MEVKIEVDHNEPQLMNMMKSKILLANRMLLEDIHRESRYNTPMSRGLPSDGDLREQVRKQVTGNQGIITWTVPYASYQERGKRFDGSHVVRNYTTPGTGKEFAKNAVKQAVTLNNIRKYLSFGSTYRP